MPIASWIVPSQACVAAGWEGSLALVFMSRYHQPNEKGTGNDALPTAIRPDSAGNGEGGAGHRTGQKGTSTRSCSSKTTVRGNSQRKGYQPGGRPQSKGWFRTRLSRQ